MRHAILTPVHLGANDEVAVYAKDDLLVVVPSRDTGFDAMLDFAKARAEACERPIAIFVLIRPGVQGDARRIREQTRTLLIEGASHLACVAYVIDGRGFFASIFMSMASGVFLHVRDAPTPMKAFSDREQACTWVSTHLGGVSWAHGYVDAVRELL